MSKYQLLSRHEDLFGERETFIFHPRNRIMVKQSIPCVLRVLRQRNPVCLKRGYLKGHKSTSGKQMRGFNYGICTPEAKEDVS